MKTVTFTLLMFLLTVSAFASQDRKTLTLRLQSPTGNSDNAVMYFDEGIVPSYDVHQDAQMVFSNVPEIPEIYSFTLDKVACSINGCGTLQTAQTVNLGYRVGSPGTYTITAAQVTNFNSTSIIKLFDNKLGITVDLRENFYQVAFDSTELNSDNRFSIQVTSSVQYSSTPSNCANTGGSITITPDSTITWDLCQLTDSVGNILQTFNDVTGQIKFNGLAAGTYQVLYSYDQYTATNTFFLNGNYVTASIDIPAQPIYTTEDVVFDAVTTNAVNYNWDFGDSTLIVGVQHPTQEYLEPGTYTVYLTTSNDQGCSATAQITVTVVDDPTAGVASNNKKDATVITLGKTISVNMHDANLTPGAQIRVYNLLGQSVASMPLVSQTENISLANQATGYYLVSIVNSNSINTKRVFIVNE